MLVSNNYRKTITEGDLLMLKKFSVKNFRGFKDWIELDLTNSKNYEFNTHCINNNIITKGMIYGKNGSGKTNLGRAIYDIQLTLCGEVYSNRKNSFLNGNTKDHLVEFRYEFLIENSTIILKYKKDKNCKLVFEHLKIDDVELYSYDYIDNSKSNLDYFSTHPELQHLILKNNSISLLRYILNNTELSELKVLKDLEKFVSGMVAFRTVENITYYSGPAFEDEKNQLEFIINNNLLEKLNNFLTQYGMDFQLKTDELPDGTIKLYFDFERPIDFIQNASSGTKALISIFWAINKLRHFTFIYIDEFDANLHFELAEAMVKLLSQQKDNQIIMTTHNTDLMTNRLMRPDCYFLLTTEKITPLYLATPRELREGHNLEKLYQAGEFSYE